MIFTRDEAANNEYDKFNSRMVRLQAFYDLWEKGLKCGYFYMLHVPDKNIEHERYMISTVDYINFEISLKPMMASAPYIRNLVDWQIEQHSISIEKITPKMTRNV